MIRYENHCCGCAAPGYPCMGRSCPYSRVEVHYCDHCGEELGYINEVGGKEFCDECLEEIFGEDD